MEAIVCLNLINIVITIQLLRRICCHIFFIFFNLSTLAFFYFLKKCTKSTLKAILNEILIRLTNLILLICINQFKLIYFQFQVFKMYL